MKKLLQSLHQSILSIRRVGFKIVLSLTRSSHLTMGMKRASPVPKWQRAGLLASSKNQNTVPYWTAMRILGIQDSRIGYLRVLLRGASTLKVIMARLASTVQASMPRIFLDLLQLGQACTTMRNIRPRQKLWEIITKSADLFQWMHTLITLP